MLFRVIWLIRRPNETSKFTRHSSLKLWLSVVVLMLVGPVTSGQTIKAAQSRGDTNAQMQPRLRCEPRTLRPGQTLTLHLPMPHGRELGVAAPGRFLFIAFRPEQGTYRKKPPIPSTRFLEMYSVRLPVSSAVGINLPADTAPEPIFTSPGTYQFIVSDNLETEDDAWTFLRCSIRFLPATRR